MARKVLAEFDAIDGPFLNKMRAIDRSIGRFETGTLNAFGRVEKGISGLLSSASQLRNVTGLVAGWLGASLATEFLDTATRIHNAMKSINSDSKEAFEGLYLAATRSLTSMDGMAQGVMRMHKVMGDTQPLSKSIRQIETLNKLLALGGKSTTERESTLLQFTQALQAGALQGDEMRALRENAPVEFLRAIAKEAGGTISDLKKFSAEAKITTDVMIRALNSLEQEADTRIKNVTLTIADGANAMRNGAIVAAEGFDKGLGLSRATVATLTTVGDLLGSNADAAEMFGQAVKAAGLVFAASLGGRAIQSNITAFRSMGPALQATAAATAATAAADYKAVQASTAKVAAIQRKVTALALEGASSTKVAAAQVALARAEVTAQAATTRYAASANAASAAQQRLAMSARATAAAGAMLRNAWAFLGGWPGLLLMAGTAALTFGASIETAADRISRLTTSTEGASNASDALIDVQSRLTEAMQEYGETGTEASRKIVEATKAELTAKRSLLELENKRLLGIQAERKAEMERLQSVVNSIAKPEDSLIGVVPKPTASSSAAETTAYADLLADAQRQYNAEAQVSLDKIKALGAEYALTEAQISRTNDMLRSATESHAARAEANLASERQAIALTDEGLAKYREKLAVLTQEADIQRLINVYGEDSVQVTVARLAAEREAYATALAAEGITGEFRDRLMEAWDAANLLSKTNIAATIAAALGPASALGDLLWRAANAWDQVKARAGIGTGPGFEGKGRSGSTAPPSREAAPTLDDLIDRYSSNGGGGGGGGGGSDPQEEALRFIEQMMTAEEKRAKQIKEMTDLRKQLVATYGPEAAIVAQLDEALQRAGESMSALDTVAKGFFDTLSDEIANSIEDWKGWGSLIRSILASLVRQHGADFFTALLTPGKQVGGGLGTLLGNLLTGQNHSGGNEHGRVPRYVSPAAFIGAPRFHNGLASDEFTAILQKGETVLPKGMILGGGGVTINMPVDMRGADESMKPYIDGRLQQLQKEFPSRVLGAIQQHKKSRSL